MSLSVRAIGEPCYKRDLSRSYQTYNERFSVTVCHQFGQRAKKQEEALVQLKMSTSFSILYSGFLSGPLFIHFIAFIGHISSMKCRPRLDSDHIMTRNRFKPSSSPDELSSRLQSYLTLDPSKAIESSCHQRLRKNTASDPHRIEGRR